MAREKGMGNLQQEKSGRWTMRVCINGKRFFRSTRTTDKAKAERFLQKFLALLMSVIADIRRTASAADLAYQSFIKHCLQNHFNHRGADIWAFGKDVFFSYLAER